MYMLYKYTDDHAIPATVGEVLFVAGKLGYSDTAFLSVLIAIFGSAIAHSYK